MRNSGVKFELPEHQQQYQAYLRSAKALARSDRTGAREVTSNLDWSIRQAAALDADDRIVSTREWQLFRDTLRKVLPTGNEHDIGLLRHNVRDKLHAELAQTRTLFEQQVFESRLSGRRPEGAAGAPVAAPVGNIGERGEDVRLRIVASNLTSGKDQTYIEHGSRILAALQPDVVLMQEFTSGTGTTRDFVDRVFGKDFDFFRGAGRIPNGVISRYPIVEAGEWDDLVVHDREVSWARIDIPGDRDLWAISVHLKAGSSSRTERGREAADILAKVRAHIPEGDYLVMGGDFNTTSHAEAAVRNLAQVFDVGEPYPADERGNGNTNKNRDHPYDRVLADKDLDPHEVPVQVGGVNAASGLVFDTRVVSNLDALPTPVERNDSGAENMQHMAVIRQFVIPATAL